MWTRRRMMQLSAATLLAGGLPRVRAQGAARTAPRYFVNIFLRGGIDAVYTTDPKTRAEVAPNVDVPYAATDIVEAGGIQFGPHFRPLQRWAGKMAILRNVAVMTANHETGGYQSARLRTGVTPNMPSLLDIIGQHRDGQPLASVALGRLSSFEHSPGAVEAPTGDVADGITALDAVDQLSDEDVALLAATYQGHLKRFPAGPLSAQAAQTRENVSQVQAFFERLKTVARFKPVEWTADRKDLRPAAEDLQRTLWFLEKDITRGVFLKIQYDWDSHYRNVEKQTKANADFTFLLDRFLMELHVRKNGHGLLADQTVLVIGSELGRFPVINGNLGKDHFPEAPYLFLGPTINTNDGKGAAFITSGQHMEAQKVSLKTGQPDRAGELVVLDDVGTTLLHMAGVNPLLYGYNGRRLSFLERT